MTLKLLMDVHVPRAVTAGLRMRGVDVLTAQEDGSDRLDDAALLDRAAALGRILFSQDDDLLRIAASRQAQAMPFSGVIYIHQQRLIVGKCIDDLHLMAELMEPQEMAARVEYLPL